MKRISLRIVYKSGYTQDVTVTDWSIDRDCDTQEITGYNFKDINPRPAYIGMSNIESVWRL